MKEMVSPLSNEKIVGCAIRLAAGIMVSVDPPLRHGDALQAARDAGYFYAEIQGAEHGFLTSSGRFVDKREAAKIADTVGQRTKPDDPSRWLSADDLW